MSDNKQLVNDLIHEVIHETYDEGLKDTELDTDSISIDLLHLFSDCSEGLDEGTLTKDEVREMVKVRVNEMTRKTEP